MTFTTDTEAIKITQIIIKGKEKQLDELAPVYKKTIKPLFLFLDKEVLLYAKLMNLKFKNKPFKNVPLKKVPKQNMAERVSKPKFNLEKKEKEDKITRFVNHLEKKHPEIKNSIISSYLELF